MHNFKTEVIKDIKKGSTNQSKSFYEDEMHASYNMLANRYMEVEVWEYRKWKLNLYLGKGSLSLSDIAKNSLRR